MSDLKLAGLFLAIFVGGVNIIKEFKFLKKKKNINIM